MDGDEIVADAETAEPTAPADAEPVTEAASITAAPVMAREDGDGEPSCISWLDDGNGNLSMLATYQPRERQIRIGGVSYVHVADLPHSAWVYRKEY